MEINKNIECCPYCGNESYYIKQSIKGTCDFYVRFDGEEAENGHIHDNLEYTNIVKYARCGKCDKRLFKLEG